MNIPQATAMRADKTYADSNVYELEGYEGIFRRLKKPAEGSILAVYDTDAMRTGHFAEYNPTPLADTKQQPHAPGPNAKIEKPDAA